MHKSQYSCNEHFSNNITYYCNVTHTVRILHICYSQYINQQLHLIKQNSWQVSNSWGWHHVAETCRRLILIIYYILLGTFVGWCIAHILFWRLRIGTYNQIPAVKSGRCCLEILCIWWRTAMNIPEKINLGVFPSVDNQISYTGRWNRFCTHLTQPVHTQSHRSLQVTSQHRLAPQFRVLVVNFLFTSLRLAQLWNNFFFSWRR